MNLKIEEAELRLKESLERSAALQPLVPEGYRVQVTLLDQNERKKRKNASAETWSPEFGLIRISFEKEAVDRTPPVPDPLSDLIKCLDLAESRPGYTFVALKWFRDVALPAGAPAWAQTDTARNDVLRDAIDRRMVLTGRIPNPKSPQFPVTTIKLNRLLPEVRAALGAQVSHEEDFEPIAIRGESLSATVLRERR